VRFFANDEHQVWNEAAWLYSSNSTKVMRLLRSLLRNTGLNNTVNCMVVLISAENHYTVIQMTHILALTKK
jgi:hypothetical protein